MSDSKKKVLENLKEFRLSSASVDNKNTVFVLTVLLAIFGVISYISMPRESFPEIQTPEIYIGTAYPGNTAMDIEKLITKPLEKEVNKITEVDEIISTSVEGYSTIQVKFVYDITPQEALRKVKDKVDAAMSNSDFPSDLPADPNIFEFNISELAPVMNVNLSGDFSIAQLNEYAEYLEEEFEEYAAVSEVDIVGVEEKEVRISVDLSRMEAMELSFRQVANVIRNENMTISSGNVTVDEFRRNVRVVGEFQSMDEIRNIMITNKKNFPIYLKDIADVEFVEKERQSYAQMNGKPVVSLNVKKKGGANLIELSENINQTIATAQQTILPNNLNISITNDQSESTEKQVADLENNIIFGMILVVLVLLFFLGFKNALFVGIAIPMSMMISFIILNVAGVTLNMMVLFSLILALGMLVDNGIVVVENVYRFMSLGLSPTQAAKKAVGEVAWPIIASTATTLAAFIPLAMWPGLIGEFMKYLPITLMIVLASSLFVALVINPVFTAVYMVVEKSERKPFKRKARITLVAIAIGALVTTLGMNAGSHALTFIGTATLAYGIFVFINHYLFEPGTTHFQNVFLPYLEEQYKRFVKYSLRGRMPFAILGGTTALLILGFILLGVFPPKTLFFPENQPTLTFIYAELPLGTDIEKTNRVTNEIQGEIKDYLKKYEVDTTINGKKQRMNYLVESTVLQVGAGASTDNFSNTSPNFGKITLNFVDMELRRGIQTSEVMNELRELLTGRPGVKITVEKNSNGPPQKKPINIEVKGIDYFKMIEESNKLMNYLNSFQIQGVEGLATDVKQSKPQLEIDIDRNKARYHGVSTAMVGDILRTSIYGKNISTFKDENDDYDINIRLKDNYRYNIESLVNQSVPVSDTKSIPISAFAKIKNTSTFDKVKRIDMDRTITIFSNVLEGYNPTEIVKEMKQKLEGYQMPNGVSYAFTGQQEDQAKEMKFLSGALLFAVFMIFLIMVMQFNSATVPFIILISVLMSLVGVLFGLLIFRMDFVVIMTMIGIISLAGVVVNNAIVLIDFTQQLIDRKREELELSEFDALPIPYVTECIIEAGKTRLRPVLLTAITTILGLIPLATGFNIDFFGLFTELKPNLFIGGDNKLFWGPMAWTVIFGLTFATFLTLIFIPAMLLIMKRAQFSIKDKAFKRRQARVQAINQLADND